MRFKRLIYTFSFVFPIFAVVCLVAYRRHHPASVSYAGSIISATSNQVAKTLLDWNFDSPDYIDASDRARLNVKLDDLLRQYNLEQRQVKEAELCCFDLLESFKTGNYSQFIKARLPSQEYTVSDGVAKGLQRYSRLPVSAASLDQYKDIWEFTFTSHSLWSQVLLQESNAIILTTNKSILNDDLDFPEFYGRKGNPFVEAFTTVAFDFQDLQKKELNDNKQVLVWRLFFMGKEQESNQARPFMITFFWNTELKKWIPIRFLHGFIKNPLVKFRFF